MYVRWEAGWSIARLHRREGMDFELTNAEHLDLSQKSAIPQMASYLENVADVAHAMRPSASSIRVGAGTGSPRHVGDVKLQQSRSSSCAAVGMPAPCGARFFF